MKHKYKLVGFVALLCVLLGMGAVSASASFTLTAEQTHKETCPTVFTVYQFIITNTGDEADTYTVSKSGSAARWALISPPGFVLQPGDSQAVFVYVTPSRNAQTGLYSLELAVTGDKGNTEKITASLNVKECHLLEILPRQTSQEICTGESTTYSFDIKNSGIWSENVRLSLAGSAAQYSSLSEEFLRLASGESRTIAIFAEPKANEIGDFDLSVTARSLESNALASQKFSLKVNGCYGVELSAAENFASFCENSEVKMPLTLKNTGTAPNKYVLDISGVDWAALDKTQISLGAGEQAVIKAVLFPAYGIYGKYVIKVSAKSEYGDTEEEVILTANVLKCHDVSLSISKSEDKICPRTSKTYLAEIMNAGAKPENFALSLNAPSWVTIDKNAFKLAESQSETINIIVTPPADIAAGKYTISLEVASQEGSKASAKDTLIIEVASKESCFGVNTVAEKERVQVAYGEGVLIPIVVENVGSEAETFFLDVSGDGASFAQLNPSSVAVEGNSAETVYLYIAVPDKTEKSSYTISVSARDEDGVISSASTIYISIAEEPAEEIEAPPLKEPEVTGFLSMFNKSFAGASRKVTGFFAGFKEGAFEFSNVKERIISYKYQFIAMVGVMLIIAGAYIASKRRKQVAGKKAKKQKRGIWQRFKDWLEQEEVEEIELVDEYSIPKEGEKKSLWKRFTDWLEEDKELTELYGEEPSAKKKPTEPKVKKEKTSLWKRFINWLEEEPARQEKKAKAKKRGDGEQKSLWQKFVDWLEEEPVEEKAARHKKAREGRKPAHKSTWQRFKDWFEEEEIEKPAKKKEKPNEKKQKKKPKTKGKQKSAWERFKDWLEEE